MLLLNNINHEQISLFRTVTGEEFKHEDSEGPVVGADVVTLVQDDLGGNVLGGAAESPSLSANLISGNIVSFFMRDKRSQLNLLAIQYKSNPFSSLYFKQNPDPYIMLRNLKY